MIVKKKTVLVLVGYFVPGFKGGGPIRSVYNLTQQLGGEFDFIVVTRDRDLGDEVPYENIRVNDWNEVGKLSVFYASPDFLSGFKILSLIRSINHDILYLNSFFCLSFTIKPLIGRFFSICRSPMVVLAPRGEFSVGALSLKSWKKIPYLFITKFFSFCKDIVWHASTEYELEDIYRVMGVRDTNVKVAHVACDLPAAFVPDYSSRVHHIPLNFDHCGVRICFLSRISPMKNLDYAVNVLRSVRIAVSFHIYGPKESSEYWLLCESLLKSLPENVKWSYCGIVSNSDVKDVLSKYDLFFVPSRGENFGHVFHEAFSAGLPVLVSDNTPWRNLVSDGIGWDISLDHPEDFKEAIEAYGCSSYEIRCRMSDACIEFASMKAVDEDVLKMNRALFNYL